MSLVGYWKLDGDATDSSGNGYDGTINGSPSTVDGVISDALHFNGTDESIEISGIPTYRVFSIALWCKTSVESNTSFFSRWDDNSANERVIIFGADNGGVLRFSIGWDGSNFNNYYSNTYIADNEWHHCAVSVSARTIKLYIDGKLETTVTYTNDIHDTSVPWEIGAFSFNEDWHLNGKVDDIRLYDHALSGTDIEILAQPRLPNAKESDYLDRQKMLHHKFEDFEEPGTSLLGEAKTVYEDSSWGTYTFNNHYRNPIVFATQNDTSGQRTQSAPVRNITSNSFEIQTGEFESGSGFDSHGSRYHGVLVFDQDIANTIDFVEAGRLDVDTYHGSTTSVSLTKTFNNTPIILAKIQEHPGEDEVVALVSNITTTGFEIYLNGVDPNNPNESGNEDYGVQDVAWIAFDPSEFPNQLQDTNIDFGTVNTNDASFSNINFSLTFNDRPALVSMLQTRNGSGGPMVPMASRPSTTGGSVANIEHEGGDSTDTHTTETAGWVAIEHGEFFAYTNDSPTVSSDVKVGSKSLHFDGNQGTFFTDKFKLGTGNWTVCSWYRPKASDDEAHILSSFADESEFACKVSTNLEPYFYAGSSFSTDPSQITPLTLDEWAHLAYVFDGSELRIYVDGSLALTETSITPKEIPERYFTIQGSNNQYVEAIHDDMRVYTSALTQEQIEEVRNTRASIDESGNIWGDFTIQRNNVDAGPGDLDVDGNGQDVVLGTSKITETGLYKISYACAWKSNSATSRHIMANEIRKNGSLLTPSLTNCYIRLDSTVGDAASNSATFVTSLDKGDEIELVGYKKQGSSGETVTVNDNNLTVEKVRNPVAQIQSSGGQDYNAGVIINFDSANHVDSEFTYSGDYLEVNQAGYYRFYYTTNVENLTADERHTVRTVILVNGTSVADTQSFSYIRDYAYGNYNHQTAVGVLNLNAGDQVQVEQDKIYRQNSNTSKTLPDHNWLTLEKVNDPFYIGFAENAISTEDVLSYDNSLPNNIPSGFSVNGSDITINNAGLYEIGYTVTWDDRETDDRRTISSWLEKNGVVLRPSRQHNYSRGYPGGRRSHNSINTLHYFDAGDVVNLVVKAEGGTIDTMGCYISMVKIEDRHSFTVQDTGYVEGEISEVGPSRELLAYWPISINATEYFNNYNGNLNGPTYTTEGYDFDGSNDYMDANFTFSEFNGYFTIITWIRTTDTANQSIFNNYGGSGNNENQIICGISNLEPRIFIDDGSTGNWLNAGTSIPNDGEFHQIIWTYNKKEVKTYIDNALVSTETYTGNQPDLSERSMRIGARRNSSTTEPFNGIIKEVRVYNTVLTERERGLLYNFYDANTTTMLKQLEDMMLIKGKMREF